MSFASVMELGFREWIFEYWRYWQYEGEDSVSVRNLENLFCVFHAVGGGEIGVQRVDI